MEQNFSGNVDLFGVPIPARRGKRGRPAHVWSQENSNRINLLFATGHEPKDCASALGISMPTLRKHYFFELEGHEAAALKLRAKNLASLAEQAESGSVAAIKELDQQIERGNLRTMSRNVQGRKSVEAEKPVKKGKKEMQTDAANAVVGIFAPREGPGASIN